MFTIESVTPWEEIEAGIREIPLLSDRNIFPYEDATITLRRCTYDDTRTTSLYVASSLLAVQEQIALDIGSSEENKEGYDTLEMEHGLVLAGPNDKGEQVLTGLIPPIVEETEEDGRYLLDGSHRTNRGRLRLQRTGFLAIHITGIRADCPAYAYPNDWSEVIEYDEIPTDPTLRKRYRQGDLYKLYRDFNALNGSRPRYGTQS